ncbi:twin-arginine translocation signal domain-containing protein, partial [Gordonia sp. (in: high G+C Gram-positive bacteria)]
MSDSSHVPAARPGISRRDFLVAGAAGAAALAAGSAAGGLAHA